MRNFYYELPPIGAEVVITITQPWVVDDEAVSSWITAAGRLVECPTELSVGQAEFVLRDELENKEHRISGLMPADTILWDFIDEIPIPHHTEEGCTELDKLLKVFAHPEWDKTFAEHELCRFVGHCFRLGINPLPRLRQITGGKVFYFDSPENWDGWRLPADSPIDTESPFIAVIDNTPEGVKILER